MIIGLVGRARSGKDSVANVLCEEYGYQRERFAGPLKDMLRTLLRAAGCPSHCLEYWIEGGGKELSCPYLMGRTPRHAMQTLGDQWGRQLIHADLWAGIGAQRAPDNGLFADVRYLNEAAAIRRHGGKIVRITRPCADILPATHTSESELDSISCDYHLANVGTLENLADKVRFMCDAFRIPRTYSRPRNWHMPMSAFTGIGK